MKSGTIVVLMLNDIPWNVFLIPESCVVTLIFPPPHFQRAVIHKLCMTLVSLLLFLTLTKSFPVTCLVDDWFVHKANFLTRLSYLYVVMQASKPKYYFAWTLGMFDGRALSE